VFLLPIIFVPSIYFSLYSAKIALLVVVTVLFIGAFLAMTLSSGLISFPRSRFLIPIALFPLIAFVSSFFSGQPIKSVAGQVFELGTSGSFLILTLLFFLAMFAFRNKVETGIKVLYYFFLSAAVVVLHLLIRAFAASILPDAVANRIPNFLLGGPIDTAIFLGVVVVATLATINMISLENRVRYIVYALLGISMAFIGAVGFMPVVVVLGLFALVYFVYTFSWSVGSGEGEQRQNRASFPALFVLAVSVIFILSSGSLAGYLSNVFGINLVEVRPNFQTTFHLIGEAWKTG
jgi:hypothetical protein